MKYNENMPNDSFALYLQLPDSELEWQIACPNHLAAIDIDFYFINPRRLRGSDFLMRWMQGRWSEEIVARSLNSTSQFAVIPYGPSTVAPEDPKELEIFFEKMDAIAQEGKRPDLLLYDRATFDEIHDELISKVKILTKVAETPSSFLHDIIRRARAGIEVENSLWVTYRMPGFGQPFTRYKRGRRKGQIKSRGPAPTVIVKEEDIPRLKERESRYGIPIYIVHIFYDRGYFIRLDEILSLLESGDLGWETQRFTNPDGTATTPKRIVKVPYILCKEFGAVKGQSLEPRTFIDKNGKVMTYVTFQGGDIELSEEVFKEWGQ